MDALPAVHATLRNAATFLVAALLIASATMAAIQTVKDLFPVRRFFQGSLVRAWLGERAGEFSTRRRRLKIPVDWGKQTATPLKGLPVSANHLTAEADLVKLATTGDRRAFYDLPVEQMCGQMAAAAGVVLDFPQNYRDLFLCLAAFAEPEDLEVVLDNERRTEKEMMALRQENPGTYQALIDARNRLTHQVQRAIDGFQVRSGYRWRWCLQVASFVLAFGLSFALVSAVGRQSALEGPLAGSKPLLAAGLGAASGFLAPVLRDIVARISSRKA
jgi:hypothetical protein